MSAPKWDKLILARNGALAYVPMFFLKKSGGAEPKFDCENYGDQGITAGCKDIYHANIDCQWLDVTELDLGTYIFKMSINPQYKASIFLAYIFLVH